MSKFIHYILYPLLFITSGCFNHSEHDYLNVFKTNEDTLSEVSMAFKKRQDSLYHYLVHFNPDSAIKHPLITARYFDSIGYGPLVAESYFFVSVFYLQVRPDDYLAFYYYYEGLKVLDRYNLPLNINNNPYHLIILGNLLFKYQLYRNALENYQQSVEISERIGNHYAKAVAYNNFGLCYQKLGVMDSAKLFFNKSMSIRSAIMPLLVAHNYTYLALLHEQMNLPDSVWQSVKKGRAVLSRQVYEKPYVKVLRVDNAILLSKVIEATFLLMEGYYFENRSHARDVVVAEQHYRDALELAKANNQADLVENSRFRLAKCLGNMRRYRESLELLDSACNHSVDRKNFVNAFGYCKTAVALAEQASDSNRVKYWMKKRDVCNDSLVKAHSSEQTLLNKVSLVNVQSQQSIRILNLVAKKHEQKMQAQTEQITFLLSIVLLLITFLIIVLEQRKKMKRVNLLLVEKAFNSMEIKRENPAESLSAGRDVTFLELQQSLETKMEETWFYLDPEMTLGKLASLLNTNEKYVSQMIRQYYKVSFNDFVNNLRVKYACQLLIDKSKNNRSIDQVALESGFQSRSTFYVAFKKSTGVTPLFFQKNAGSV
jgi:AraC-like DNA-binding protein